MTGTVSPLPRESQSLGQGGQRPDEFSRRLVRYAVLWLQVLQKDVGTAGMVHLTAMRT